MKRFFSLYPELILIDATYKLTNLRMPLYIVLAIGPNGESEIVAIFVTASEDALTLTNALETFKSKNVKWTETVTIFTDKDMTERDSLRTTFPNAVLLLCLFHVLRAMSREVTVLKMGISESQRLYALRALQKMAYASSEIAFEELRQDFNEKMPSSVVRYFETNWNNCKNEWVYCWQQQNLTFGQRTTNRLESVNRRTKSVLNLLNPLPLFFKDLFSVIDVMRKERNHSFVTAAERISVHAVLDNDVLEEFSKVLTPYALNFVRSQLHEALEVYPGGDNDHPTCEILGSEVLVNELNCHCIFFKSMGLPCKHMFVARRIKQLPIFFFDGISIRWLKSHATENHRLFQHHSENHNYLEIGVNKERTLTQAEKFKKACRLSQRLAQLVSEGGHSEFESRINILQNLVKIWEDYKHAKVTVLESSIDLITNTTSECAMSSKINLNNDVLCDITKKAFIPPTSNIVLTCNETFYQTNMHALEVSKSDNLEKLSDFEKSLHLEQSQLDIEQDNFNKSAEIVAEMSSQPCNKIIHVSNQTSIPIVIENPIEDSEERVGNFCFILL
ncbi:uncharacterized protein LOC136080792 [Hydra vulgaris]|uniref:Uncharacterized protein LOC136080792 n=1 Tax=Hydra vulgaris TaxID=6087 RepID=A0ABM4BXR3_HYDVU